MTVSLNLEQVELVLRYAEPIKGQKRERFMNSLGRILEDAPGNDYIVATIALALDAVIAEEKDLTESADHHGRSL